MIEPPEPPLQPASSGSASEPTPGLRPVPGTARGRGRVVVDLAAELVPRPTRRRAGVVRRALRRELTRPRDPRPVLPMAPLLLIFALAAAGRGAPRAGPRGRAPPALGGGPGLARGG